MAVDLISMPVTIDRSEMRTKYFNNMKSHDYKNAVMVGKQLLESVDGDTTNSLRFAGYSYIGQAYLALDEYDSAMFFLSKGFDLWNSKKDSFLKNVDVKTIESEEELVPVFILFNSLGIYSVNKEMNYEKAAGYF